MECSSFHDSVVPVSLFLISESWGKLNEFYELYEFCEFYEFCELYELHEFYELYEFCEFYELGLTLPPQQLAMEGGRMKNDMVRAARGSCGQTKYEK
ncbi:hypothetical protein ACFL43_04865 [Thermodesulfobacteriota bacterium]